MDRPASATGSRRSFLPLVCAAALLPQLGCIASAIYADGQLQPYLRALPRRASYPLARTLTWKYLYTLDVGKPQPRTWFVADGKFVTSAQQLSGVAMYAAQPTTSGTAMSAVYTDRAHQATARGQHDSAQVFHGLATTSVQTQIASEQMAATLGLMGAMINFGEALGEALTSSAILNGSQATANYVLRRRAAVSDLAPPGTVLELFFRAHRADKQQGADITMRWETVATLRDPWGRIWRSSAWFTMYQWYSFGSTANVPLGYQRGNYVPLQLGSIVPANARNAYVAESQELATIDSGAYHELCVAATAAIDGLYAQIEYASSQRQPVAPSPPAPPPMPAAPPPPATAAPPPALPPPPATAAPPPALPPPVEAPAPPPPNPM